MSSGYGRSGLVTPQMRAVASSAAAGRRVCETARELGISESTVWTIRSALCARLHVPNMIAAVHELDRRGVPL